MADQDALQERAARKSVQARFEAAYPEAEAKLLAIPGAISVGIGLRERGGELTSEPVFRAYVRHKRPLAELTEGERIPAEILGFPVDVLVVRDSIPIIGFDDENDDANYRTKVGGAKIGIDVSGSGLGTLGCFVRTADGKVAILSNYHVLMDGGADIGVGQPDHSDLLCCTCNEIAKTVAKKTNAATVDELDCAIAVLKPGVRFQPKIRTIKRPDGTVELEGLLTGSEAATFGDTVWKVGERTGLTRGIISAVSPQVEVSPSPPFAYFANHGDSGSVIVELSTGRVVALLSRIDKEIVDGGKLGLGTPIAPVLSELGVTIIPSSEGEGTVLGWDEDRIGLVAEPRPEDVFAAIADRLQMTPSGGGILSLYRHHAKEISTLVNQCRPVTIAWQRNAGPTSLAAVIRSVREPIYRLPSILNDVPREQLADRLLDALGENGSVELQEALASYAPEIRRVWLVHDTVDAMLSDFGASQMFVIAAE